MGPRPDWVYRDNVFDSAGAVVDDLGTYQNTVGTLTVGDINANAGVLYDSHNYIKNVMVSGGFLQGGVSPAGRAEGGRARILRVQGVIMLNPSTWALGSSYDFGCRFGVFEQDPNSGAFLIDPNYNMWSGSTNINFRPALWANDRAWQHERRISVQFNDNSQRQMLRFNFGVKRSLAPNMCYGVYMATGAGSVTLQVRTWLRTLVSDEA